MAAQDKVKNGTANEEENKIGQAYLTGGAETDSKNPGAGAEEPSTSGGDPCPYCKDQEDTEAEDCSHCADYDATRGNSDRPADATEGDGPQDQYVSVHDEAEGDACPHCDDYDSAQEGSSHADDCPHCADYDANNCPECAEYDAKQGGIQDATQNGEGLEGIGEGPANGDKLGNGQSAVDSVTAQLDGAPMEGQTPADIASQLDDTDMAIDTNTDQDQQVPSPNDETDAPTSMGLSEDDADEDGPDLSAVLSGGLDQHAENMQKEKVTQLIGQALEGFKASKDILEQAKEQAPELYTAHIAMLKAMIEMAKMLGLGPSQDAPSQQDQNPSAPPAAAPQEGAAQAPQQ